jgi:hypothetical protein
MRQGEAFSRVKIDAQLKDVGWNLSDGRGARYEYPLDDPCRPRPLRSARPLSAGRSVRRAGKTLAAMRAHPLDWWIEDLEAVARAFGINVRRPGAMYTSRILGSAKASAYRPAA